MQDFEYWIWLSRIKNVNIRLLYELLKIYKTPKNLFYVSSMELIDIGLTVQDSEEITNEFIRKNLNQFTNYMIINKIEMINIFDKDYPQVLKNIYNPPLVLYLKGDKNVLKANKKIAIVGSRNCSKYGEKICTDYSYGLAKEDIIITSGLARGIDTYAHIGALRAKKQTIAVVGCGLDRIYPIENTKLFYNIIDLGGLIISEYVIGTKPLAENFPMRNRIISGISDRILVVEAGEQSGALTTVEYALEQGKEVFTIPGNINSYSSIGTNNLIKDGANIVTNINDILENFH